jgi:hypothetical protein
LETLKHAFPSRSVLSFAMMKYKQTSHFWINSILNYAQNHWNCTAAAKELSPMSLAVRSADQFKNHGE